MRRYTSNAHVQTVPAARYLDEPRRHIISPTPSRAQVFRCRMLIIRNSPHGNSGVGESTLRATQRGEPATGNDARTSPLELPGRDEEGALKLIGRMRPGLSSGSSGSATPSPALVVSTPLGRP